MKRSLSLFLFVAIALLICMPSMADDTNKVTIGVSIDSMEVKADSLSFGHFIKNVQTAPGAEYILLKLHDTTKNGKYFKNKGEFGVLNLEDHKLRWKKPYNMLASDIHCCKAGVVVVTYHTEVTMFNPVTGEECWKTKFFPVQFDDSTNIVLGYKNIWSSELSGYDLSTGEKKWTVNLPHKKNWGWNNVVREDSVHWLIVADNLNRLNIQTGELFTYEAKTGVADVKRTLLLDSQRHYSPLYPTGAVSQRAVSRLHSNVLCDDSLYYFADRQNVVALDSTMNVVWSYSMPPKTAAFSQLICNDSTLYMFSLGYGLLDGYKRQKMGRPFVATFDKRTGDCRFMNMLSVKKDIVEDAVLESDGILMLFDDGLAYKHDLNDSTVTVSPWDVKKYGKLCGFCKDVFYAYYHLKNMFDVISYDGNSFPVVTENSNIYVVDRNLRVSDNYPVYSLYKPVMMIGDRMCVKSVVNEVRDVWLTTIQGVPEIKLTVPVLGMDVIQNKLYLCNYDCLYCLPLDDSVTK